MRKALIIIAIILAVILAGLLIRILQLTMMPGSPMVLREDTRPMIQHEQSSSATSSAANIVEVHVPVGMKFVASKKGTKYYAVESAGGERIVPQNRVYFATAAEAEAAGYQP